MAYFDTPVPNIDENERKKAIRVVIKGIFTLSVSLFTSIMSGFLSAKLLQNDIRYFSYESAVKVVEKTPFSLPSIMMPQFHTKDAGLRDFNFCTGSPFQTDINEGDGGGTCRVQLSNETTFSFELLAPFAPFRPEYFAKPKIEIRKKEKKIHLPPGPGLCILKTHLMECFQKSVCPQLKQGKEAKITEDEARNLTAIISYFVQC